MEWINWGGKDRPIHFGVAMALIYEEKYQRSFQSDFFSLSLSTMLTEMQDAKQVTEALDGKLNITTLVNIVWSALVAGCEREREPEDFRRFDVALWIDEDSEKTMSVLQGIYNALPRERKGEKADASKKKIPLKGRRMA